MPEPLLSLETCSFLEPDLRLLRRELAKSNGLILCSGPRASGITTTLYACACHVAADPHRKTISLERELYGDMGLAIRLQYDDTPDAGLPRLLGSALLAAPDLVMVPELGDPEVVRLALRAALTGQLVITELPADSTVDALLALLARNPLPFHVADVVRLVINQRLLPRLCPSCRRVEPLSPGLQGWVNQVWKLHRLPPAEAPTRASQASGCGDCDGTGRLGHIPIAEFLTLDDELRDAARQPSTAPRLRLMAIQRGTRHLALDGIHKAAAGHLDLADVQTALAADPLL